MSITAAEIYVGAIWERNPNAIFLIRDSNAISEQSVVQLHDEELDVDAILTYYHDSGADRQSVEHLKQHIRRTYNDQTVDYTCDVLGTLDEQPKKLQLGNFRRVHDGFSFESLVLDFFKCRIAQQYPRFADRPTSPSVFEVQRQQHREYIRQCNSPFGREAEINEISQYIDQDHASGKHFYSLTFLNLSLVIKQSRMYVYLKIVVLQTLFGLKRKLHLAKKYFLYVILLRSEFALFVK